MKRILHYLSFTDQVDLLRLRNQLSPKECEVLRLIAKNHLSGGNTRAMHLLETEYLGSPSTIHANVKRLMSKKMVLTSEDALDNRIKYLVPSAKALKVLTELGELISSASNNPLSLKTAEALGNDYSVIEIDSLAASKADE